MGPRGDPWQHHQSDQNIDLQNKNGFPVHNKQAAF